MHVAVSYGTQSCLPKVGVGPFLVRVHSLLGYNS